MWLNGFCTEKTVRYVLISVNIIVSITLLRVVDKHVKLKCEIKVRIFSVQEHLEP